jgi:3-deoxy-D-manno-octulosonate 8-phosphate phosphatase (KDO 8-P phosphatase)
MDESEASRRAAAVELVLMDVDGTLTDGTIWVLPDGEEVKGYSVRDGLGIFLGRMAGLSFGIITGKRSQALEKRAEKLGIGEVHQGVLDKASALASILERHGLAAAQAAYIGDDLGDLAVMEGVGLAAAVADAHPEVKARAHYVCSLPGGRGAVREFIEFIVRAKGKWDEVKTRAHEIRNFKP